MVGKDVGWDAGAALVESVEVAEGEGLEGAVVS